MTLTCSKLMFGTGTHGRTGFSYQAALGLDLVALLVLAYRLGVRHFDTADAYGTHEHVKLAWKELGEPHDFIVMTKTDARFGNSVKLDLERFADELGKRPEIVLLHAVHDDEVDTVLADALSALEEGQSRGTHGIHGASFHGSKALSRWVSSDRLFVVMAALNPRGTRMCGESESIKSQLHLVRQSGRMSIAMKILGGRGELANDEGWGYARAALGDSVSMVSVGLRSEGELRWAIQKIEHEG